jgi:hypothetical protein
MELITLSRLFSSRRILLLGLAASLAAGCANISVRYEDTPQGINDMVNRHLASPDQYLSYAEFSKRNNATIAKDHLKDVQHKLLSDSLFLLRFTSDCEIHNLNADRATPPERVLSALTQAFPEDASELAAKSNLQGEFKPGRDVTTPGVTGSTEEIWLVYDKKTNKYYLYANSKPDKKDLTSEPAKFVPLRHW